MSQPANWGVPQNAGESGTPYPMSTMMPRLDSVLDALLSMHSGSTAPTYAVLGTLWLDTSATPNVVRIYTGTAWLAVFSVDTASGLLSHLMRDGTAAAPALTFASDTDSGLYLASGEARVSFSGAHVLSLAPASNTDALAGVNTKNPLTAAALASGNLTGFSLRLPGNIQIVYAEVDVTTNASGDAGYTFPVTFSARPSAVVVSGGNPTSEWISELSPASRTASGTTFSFRPSPGVTTRRVNVWAVGPKS